MSTIALFTIIAKNCKDKCKDLALNSTLNRFNDFANKDRSPTFTFCFQNWIFTFILIAPNCSNPLLHYYLKKYILVCWY